MRIRTKKWASPIFIISLAVAGIFGASAAIANKQVEETPVVEEVKAEETEAVKAEKSETIWLNFSNCSWFVPYVSYQFSDGTWSSRYEMDIVEANKLAKWYRPVAGMYGIRFFHSTGDYGNHCRTRDLKFVYEEPAINAYCCKNYFTLGAQPQEVDKYIEGSWSYNTGMTYTLRFNKASREASGTMTDQQVWLDNCLIKEGTFVREGYVIDAWTLYESGLGNRYYSGTRYEWSKSLSMQDGEVIDLYAQWKRVTSHTITYDRNKRTGLQETQEKGIGVNVNAYTPGIDPLTDEGWNPSPYKRFDHWNTKYDDSGDRVNAGGTITTDENFTLYYIEDWYDFRYRVDSGSWVSLVHNDEGKGSGVVAQFAPASPKLLPIHGIISFQYSSNGGSTWTDFDSVSFEAGCNYDTTTGIKLETTDTIYLKYLDSGDFTCYVPGISDRTICVFDTSSATDGGTPYSMRGTSDTQTVTTMDVVIEKGQFVRRGYDGNYTYGSILVGGEESAASCFSQVGSETCVECLVTGVYTVYNQAGSLNNWKDIYITRNEAESAKYLAQIFNGIIAPICTDIVGGSKSLVNLQAVWGDVDTSELYKHFHNQTDDTMAYFSTSSTTTDIDILACVAKYDYIENKYGTTALPDFLGRNNSYPTSGAIRHFTPFELLSDEDNNYSSIIIIVASSVALLSITALSVLVIKKKRKQD